MDLTTLLMGAISVMAGAIAFMYKRSDDEKTKLINRLLDAQERQAEQQEEQVGVSKRVAAVVTRRTLK